MTTRTPEYPSVRPHRVAVARWRWVLGSRAFLFCLLAVYLLAAGTYGMVGIIDPYALRHAGVAARFADHTYPDYVVPLLSSVAARNGTDVVVVGGSTSMGYTAAMIRRAFPQAKQPFNLSFLGPSARDIDLILSRLEVSTSVQRIFLSLEWSFIKDVPEFGRVWDKPPNRHEWYNPIPDYNLETIHLALHVLSTGELDLPEWHGTRPDLPEFMVHGTTLPNVPKTLANLKRLVATNRPRVTAMPILSCASLPLVRDVLVPRLRRLAARGVAVDIVVPPYSLAAYFDTESLVGRKLGGDGALFANFMGLRHCVLKMTAAISGVRVHAFDTDVALTGDLSRYNDATHLQNYEDYQELLLRVARGSDVLSVAGWPAYETSLTAAIQTFAPSP